MIDRVKRILGTWSKEDLIDDVIMGMNSQDLQEFVEVNEELED